MSYQRTGGFQLTPVTAIIGLCAMLSIMSWLVPETYKYLSLRPDKLVEQPWTIVTSIFMHAPLWRYVYHLVANMWMLYLYSKGLSGFIGERKMLAVFFVGALLGNALYVLIAFTPFGNPYSWVVGASGGVFALGGALAVLTPRTRVLVFGIVPAPLWVFVVGSMVIFAFFPRVAWEAHLGGLLLGAGVGYYFKRKLHRRYWW